MDRLRAFEIFVAVVARGGFARAADALGTSPANVSRYVVELETHLGTRLLNRSSRRVSLTEAGQLLYDRARTIVEDAAEAEALASTASTKARGKLRINAPTSFGVLHLAPLWPELLAKHPELELEIALGDRVVDLIDEGYDLAIRISRSGSIDHVARKLATSRNVICASPAYLARRGAPKSPGDLASHDCIGYTLSATGDEWHLLDERDQTHRARVACVMRTNNGDTARAAALAGRGIIWQPTFLIGADLRSGALVPVCPGYRIPDIDVLAIYPSRVHLTAKVRVTLDFLAASFAGTPPWDS